MKKAQAWSMDVMVAVIFFIIIIGAVIYISFFRAHKEKMQVLEDEAGILYQGLAEDNDIKIIDDSKIDISQLNKTIVEKGYDVVKYEAGIRNDFCIYFVDENGQLIYLNGTHRIPGIGSERITINGEPCR